MIRFCDKEVYCVIENEWKTSRTIIQFLNQHRDDIVCIQNQEEKFRGSITYKGLCGELFRDTEGMNKEISFQVMEKCLFKAICREYIILNEHIWENGRKYFANAQKEWYGLTLLPIVDEGEHLICFAWQDNEANRELRMLDELMQCGKRALGFHDVFPKYDCVTVHGCNELAYYFIKYLKKQGISVNVTEKMWEQCDVWKDFWGSKEETLEYTNYVVYAEGIDYKEKGIEQRRSVSAEFECIDRVYEANICSGWINDAEESQEFLEYLYNNQIGILGVDLSAMNAYDILLKNGLDIACFISDLEQETTKTLFNKRIMSMARAIESIENIIFIDPHAQYSTWGGGIDYYHYNFGLVRNKNFFSLRDYMEVLNGGLLNIIKHLIEKSGYRLVLLGNLQYCIRLKQIIQAYNKRIVGEIVYCDILDEYINENISGIFQIQVNQIEKMDLCMMLVSDYYHYDLTQIRFWSVNVKQRILAKLKEHSVSNIIDYPCHNEAMLEYRNEQSARVKLKVGKIIIGGIEPYSGNIFLRGLLDNHPDILMLEYSSLNSNLFSICTSLSIEKGCNILSKFWNLFDTHYIQDLNNNWELDKREVFHKAMQEMLSDKDTFTSQELFVMIHIAHAKMRGRNITDISSMIIYWEPHCVPINECEDYAIWLKDAAVSGYILNLMRDSCIRSGSLLNSMEKERKAFGGEVFGIALQSPNDEKKEYPNWKRVVVKFEDIKLYPHEQLHALCNQLGLAWSDTLLETTLHGEPEFYGKITGFDLAPVYRTHEEFFSAFDRFRISLITSPWQKKYGYPYVNSLNFSRRELQELFEKEFRFENRIHYQSEEEKIAVKRWVQKLVSDLLWEVRREEIMEQKEKRYLK